MLQFGCRTRQRTGETADSTLCIGKIREPTTVEKMDKCSCVGVGKDASTFNLVMPFSHEYQNLNIQNHDLTDHQLTFSSFLPVIASMGRIFIDSNQLKSQSDTDSSCSNYSHLRPPRLVSIAQLFCEASSSIFCVQIRPCQLPRSQDSLFLNIRASAAWPVLEIELLRPNPACFTGFTLNIRMN